jgi:KAP family P-loop domain
MSAMMIPGDNPIRRRDQDGLGRAAVAQSFVRQVLSLDASEGLVVAILGAWGSGKTSFLNLAREDFAGAKVPVLDFNPWMFSGAEQLVESFFTELAAQLKIRPGLADVAADLADYGEAFSNLTWLPVVGPWIDRSRGGARVLSKLLQRRKEGTGARRHKLEAALGDLEVPIVVVLDDIDRLATSEIRDVFKLVRLTASFPNIVYVLAFDRGRVETALSEEGIRGRDYLEKILQVAMDLPGVPYEVLSRQILTAINEAIQDLGNPGVFDKDAWPDVFMEVIRPLVRNMRDVRRYAASIHGTVEGLGGEIALADVLALEALRVFLPDAFSELAGAVEGLTSPSEVFQRGHQDPPELKAAIERLLGAAEPHQQVVRTMITRLFPAAGRHVGGTHYGSSWQTRWLRERRVAHDQILRLYLERVAGDALEAFSDAERAWHMMADREAFEACIRRLEPERQEDVVAALETYEDQYRAEHVVPGCIVLLNLLPDLPDRPRGMVALDARLVVGRVTLRLLRSLGEAAAVESIVPEILSELTTLSSKFELITDVGHREGAGHKLVSESVAVELERSWRTEVRAASLDQLVAERDLLRVLLFARRGAAGDEPAFEVPMAPELTLSLLRAAKGEVPAQSMDSRTVRSFARLSWDALVSLYGGEATLRDRVDLLKATNPPGETELLDLVDKYLDGWRPEPFGED